LLALPVSAALNVVVRHARDSYTASSLFAQPRQDGPAG
jgi:hypothetical protein